MLIHAGGRKKRPGGAHRVQHGPFVKPPRLAGIIIQAPGNKPGAFLFSRSLD